MDFLNKCKGLLRTVGGVLGGVGSVLVTLPDPHALAIGAFLLKAGGIIGGLGVLRATAAKITN